MEVCPWRERPIGDPYYVCTRFWGDTVVLCDGACSWVADYHRLKELKKTKR